MTKLEQAAAKAAQSIQAAEKKKKVFSSLFKNATGLEKIALTEYPPIDWTVENLLPTGFAIFSGGTKLGKTWICLQLASAVSLGLPFLGNASYPCKKGEVLLLALQISDRMLHNRMEVAGILGDDRVRVLHTFPRGGDAIEAVRRWKELHPATRLVIIDMLEQVRDRDPEHENKYSVNVQEISQWAQLAEELKITILGTTHDRKASSTDYVSDIVGSVGAVGSAAVLLSLKRSRGKADAILFASGWEIVDHELPLVFDQQTAWRLLDGTVQEREQSKEREEILKLLQDSNIAMPPRDIATALNKNPSSTRSLLFQMEKAGSVSKSSRGMYIYTNTPTPSLANTTNNTTNKQTDTHARAAGNGLLVVGSESVGIVGAHVDGSGAHVSFDPEDTFPDDIPEQSDKADAPGTEGTFEDDLPWPAEKEKKDQAEDEEILF